MTAQTPPPWLGTLASLGGFFSLVPAPGPGALPWSQVLAEDCLAPRLDAVRTALAGSTGLAPHQVDRQVAVSATQVGLASRLWSVVLATTVVHGWLPGLTSPNLLASPEHRGPVPLGIADTRAGYAVPTLPESVTTIDEVLVHGSLAELEAACAQVGRTPRAVLASNSASALVGGARVLASRLPEHGEAAWALVRALLTGTGLARGGRVVERRDLSEGVGGEMAGADEAFLRSGCCVFYRIPEHGLCPDCVLAPSHPDRVTPGH